MNVFILILKDIWLWFNVVNYPHYFLTAYKSLWLLPVLAGTLYSKKPDILLITTIKWYSAKFIAIEKFEKQHKCMFFLLASLIIALHYKLHKTTSVIVTVSIPYSMLLMVVSFSQLTSIIVRTTRKL